MSELKTSRQVCINIFDKIVIFAVTVFLCCCLYNGMEIIRDYCSITNRSYEIQRPQYTVFAQQIAENSIIRKKNDVKADSSQISASAKGEFDDILDKITKEIFSFAEQSGQFLPTYEVRNNILAACQAVRDSIPIADNLNLLYEQICILGSKADTLKNISKIDLRYYTWADFLDFYFADIKKSIRIKNDNDRMQQKFNELKYEKISKRLGTLQIFFALFCICMMFIVVISIEKNTQLMLDMKNILINDKNSGKSDIS